MRKIVFILFLLPVLLLGQATYYVTLSGSNSNNGLSEGNAWRTLAYAESQLSQSDIVNVKVGNYGDDRIVINVDNVSFIGYNTTPGDMDRAIGDGPLWLYKTQAFSNTRYPTITGTDVFTQVGITISASNVTIKNLQITNVTFGVNSTGNNVVMDNLSVYEIGDTNGDEGNPATNQYSVGIRLRGNNGTIRNSIAFNTSEEGISFSGPSSTNRSSGGLSEDNISYSNKTTAQNGMDYFMLIGNSDNNIVRRAYVEQRNDTNSGRHGLVIKGSGTGNLFEDCETSGLNIEANFVAVNGNTWRNITIDGRFSTGSAGTGGRIRISNGANNNLFENIKMFDCRYGISFADWDDGAVSGGNAASEFGGGNDNDLVNIVLYDINSAIYFESFQALSTADNNRIFNLTVHNSDRLFEADMENSGTKLYNVVLDDVDNLVSDSDFALNANTVFSYVNVNNSFATSAFTPYLENNITSIPFTFTNEGVNDYSISTNALDVGQNLSGILSNAAFDFNGNARVPVYTLGAYEFGGAPPTGDVDIPIVLSSTLLSVTETTFRMDWTLDEGSKGRIRYGTSTGVYPFQTTLENGYLTRHIQTVGGNNAPLLNPGTTYYFQYYLEDIAGNLGYSAEYTQTTLGEGVPEEPSPVTITDNRAKYLRFKKVF